MFTIWAGIDIGKEHHHCVAPDARGERRLSRRVGNDEPELLELIRDVLALADQGEVLWAMDTNRGSAALLIGLLLESGQSMTYLTGRTVHRASAGYRGQSKTDAKDAHVIADQARMRQDLGRLRPGDKVAVDLRVSPVAAWTSSTAAVGRSTGCANNSSRSSRPWSAPCPAKAEDPSPS
ncbi:IS110 family transposase [Streptomyces venezuelae]|uniref:IS110 family transposase n=1 Tax=Streptomyces venezuelae TaxID=54571 RepID=UPI00378CC96A